MQHLQTEHGGGSTTKYSQTTRVARKPFWSLLRSCQRWVITSPTYFKAKVHASCLNNVCLWGQVASLWLLPETQIQPFHSRMFSSQELQRWRESIIQSKHGILSQQNWRTLLLWSCLNCEKRECSGKGWPGSRWARLQFGFTLVASQWEWHCLPPLRLIPVWSKQHFAETAFPSSQ